jgi:hypothetical protein
MKTLITAIILLIGSTLYSQEISVLKRGQLIDLHTALYQRGKVVGQIDTMYFSNIGRTVYLNDSIIHVDMLIPEVEVTLYQKISKRQVEEMVRCAIYHLIGESFSPVIRITNGHLVK